MEIFNNSLHNIMSSARGIDLLSLRYRHELFQSTFFANLEIVPI